MEILKWAALSLFTVFIGAIAGFGFTTRRVFIVWYHIAAIILFIFMVSLASTFIGQFLTFISVRVLEVLVGLGLISLGIILIRSKPMYPGSKDLLLLTLAIQLDVILLSFHYVQTYQAGFGLAFTISLLLSGSIVGGMILGQKRWSNWRVVMLLPYVPGICFILIGVIKVI